MLMKRSEAERRGLPIMAALRSFAVVGVPPAIMGIGPAVAVPEALRKAHISKDDVDIFEINEAFGSQVSSAPHCSDCSCPSTHTSRGPIIIIHRLHTASASSAYQWRRSTLTVAALRWATP